MKPFRSSSARLLSSALALAVGVANAQQDEPTPATAVEEVVVTVQRRPEPSAAVPMAIASLPAAALESAGVTGMLDLAQAAPGLVMSRFGMLVQPALRGVTARLGENSVATYVDGFYVPNAVSLDASFNHVARVDVLKGPQGTLFGRNTTGGAILITTREPVREPAFSVAGGIEQLDGRRDGRAFELYGSTGLGDFSAVDVAVTHREANGWIRDLRGGDPVNAQERQNLRAKLVYEPRDALTVSVIAEHGTLDDTTVTGALSFYSHRLFPAVLPPDPTLPLPSEPNIVASSKPPRNTADWTAGYGKVEWANDKVAFASLTSYRTDESVLDMDFDGSAAVNPPVPGGTNLAWRLEEETLQQELTVRSIADRRLGWVAGFYAFDDRIEQVFMPENVVATQREGRAASDTLALSVFMDIRFALTDALEVNAGARYSWEEKDGRYASAAPPAAFADEIDFDDVTPRLAVRYELSRTASVYASLSEGFKSGFVNASAGGVSSTGSEELTAYEIGYKARRGRLALDLAMYDYDWSNLQVARFEPAAGGNIVENAARADIRGIDLQAAWNASERFELRASAAYIDGEYADFPAATVTVSAQPDDPAFPNELLPATQDWSGNPTIRTPEWTGNLGWTYARPMRRGAFALTGNVYYTSEFAPNTAREHPQSGVPDLTSGPYTLVNMGLTWTSPRGMSITLYGRNLADERYVLSRDANAFGEYRAFGEPRVLGLRVAFASR